MIVLDSNATVEVQCFFKPYAKIRESYIVLTDGNNLTVSKTELHSNGSVKLGPLHPGNYLLLVYEIGVKDSISPAYYQQWIIIQDTNGTLESSSVIPTTTSICTFNINMALKLNSFV